MSASRINVPSSYQHYTKALHQRLSECMQNPYGNPFNDDGEQQKKQRIVSVINSTIPASGFSWNGNRLTFRMDPAASDKLDKEKTLATIRGASPDITRVQADDRGIVTVTADL